jgi:hypothetical protein
MFREQPQWQYEVLCHYFHLEEALQVLYVAPLEIVPLHISGNPYGAKGTIAPY